MTIIYFNHMRSLLWKTNQLPTQILDSSIIYIHYKFPGLLNGGTFAWLNLFSRTVKFTD